MIDTIASTKEDRARWINKNYPVKAVTVYENGVIEVRRISMLGPQKESQKGNRTGITELSKKSLMRLAFLCSVNSHKFGSMLTLTYGAQFPIDGKIVKSDLNRFLTAFRRMAGCKDYVWFLEFQKRSAPHFHIMSNHPAPSVSQRARAAIIWVKATKTPDIPYTSLRSRKRHSLQTAMLEFSQGSPKFWEGLRSRDAAKRYALKYCLKPEQKTVPKLYSNVGRFWGASRSCSKVEGLTIEVSEEDMRKYLNQNVKRLADSLVIPKFIF